MATEASWAFLGSLGIIGKPSWDILEGTGATLVARGKAQGTLRGRGCPYQALVASGGGKPRGARGRASRSYMRDDI